MATQATLDHSPEYLSFQENFGALVSTFKAQPAAYADHLFSNGYIPDEVFEFSRLNGVMDSDKSRKILDAIIDRIELSPIVFHGFIKAIATPSTDDVVKKLHDSYERHKTATSRVEQPQPSPPTHQQLPPEAPTSFSFPYLDTSNLDEDDRIELKDRLIRDTKKMMFDFTAFTLNIQESFEKRIQLDKIKYSVLSLEMFDPEDKQKIENAKNVAQIFITLRIRDYISFFNYEIVQYLIELLGSPDDHKRLDKYRSALYQFGQRNVFEVPAEVFSSKYCKKTAKVFVLKCTEQVATLEYVKRLTLKIAEALGLKEAVLQLRSVRQGCLELHFLITVAVAKRIYPVSPTVQAALSVMGVKVLTCGSTDEVEELLLEHAVVVEMADDSQSCDTPLHTAASRGDLDEVRKLLITKQYELDARNSHNQTSLHLACANGHLDTVWTLANDFGADIGAIDTGKNTPLLFAAKNKHVQIIILLILLSMLGRQLFNGIRQPCSFSHTELDSHHVKIFEDVLFEYYNNSKAVDKTMQMISNFFLDQYTDYNNEGFFALLVAASLGLKDLIDRLVVEKKADLNIKGFRGLSVLHCACYGGHVLLVESLASKYGLNPADRDDIGNTPLHIAAMKGHIETVRHLISKQSCKLDGIDNQSNTPLMLAALTGNSHVLDVLVKEFNSSCHVRGYKGRTLLHQACNGGHIELIDKLVVEYGLDLKYIDNDGNTPLHVAAMFGHVEAVIHLIGKHSADVDCTNNNNNTPLMQAALSGHAHVLDAFVKEFNSSCHVRGYNGRTLLHSACDRGHIELIDKLVMEYHLDPADRNGKGNTPLHIAAMKGHVEAVRHLISKHSADINSINNKNNTPLMLAALNGHAHVLDAFFKKFNSSCHVRSYNGCTLLHYACEGGHIEVIDTLVMKYGLNPEDRDGKGNTPLHIAAMKGHVEAVRHLISKHNAVVDCINKRKSTPLMLAVLSGDAHVLDVLVREFKSSCDVRGHNGRTLLHQACDRGHIELIDKLVMEYGLSPEDRNGKGNTPLHIAASKGHVETVKHLIRNHKVETNITNNKNSSPLCLAAVSGHAVVLHALIKEFNCNPHVRGYNGQTLLHYACKYGHIETLNNLEVKYKVDPTIRDNDGNTPLHILCRAPYTEEEKLGTILCKFQYWTVFQVNNDGNTPLHTATRYGQVHCARLLLQKCNAPLFVRNKDGKTALDLAKARKNQEIITLFKHHNSKIQSTYQQLDKLAQQKFGGIKNLTRLFVVGHPGAGKSTLVKTIKKEGFFSFFSTSSIKLHTAGIIPSTYDSSAYGRMILYDFAGDSEYYSSHAAIMESIDTSKGSNIYLIVCDLSEGEKDAATKYSYWLSFLSYNIKQFSNTVVLLVGSHADVITRTSIEQALSVLDSISQKFCSSSKIGNLHIEQSVALDCRKREAVVNDIKKLAKRFSKFVSPIGLSPETSTLLGLLKKDFEHVSACKVSLLISHIKDTEIPLPVNSLSLYTLIRELHDLGLLMVIEREGDFIENHIIILKISTFTSDVHSKLFSKSAKADLTKHIDQLKFSVGIIPESLLKKVLPKYITKESLLKLQYCQEIENLYVEEDHTLSQVIPRTVSTESATKEKSHLFFPALCDLKLEDIQWPKSEGDKITLGWYAKCDDYGFDFFPTRFLHVLIVHLSHSFALKQDLPTSHRLSIETIHCDYSTHNSSLIAEVYATNPRCHVWSTGLHWLMKNGVEVFVDMPKDANNKELIVLARSKVQNQVECANTLRAVIQKTVNTKFKFCAGIVPTVYLLDPSNLKDEPFTNARTVPKYSLRDIEKALAEGTEQVTDKEGECFSTPIKDWISRTRLASSYWNFVFPMDTFLVHSALEGVNGDQWKLLGLNLSISWIDLDIIENEASFPGDIAKKEEVIRLWMLTQKPTWKMLAEALSQPSIGLFQEANQISQAHNVTLQEKILEGNSSFRPDEDFLQLFAALIGSRWQCLASPLSLTSEDIVSIKRDTKEAEPTRQALIMLQKWAAKETATYGQLREKLSIRTVSGFTI